MRGKKYYLCFISDTLVYNGSGHQVSLIKVFDWSTIVWIGLNLAGSSDQWKLETLPLPPPI